MKDPQASIKTEVKHRVQKESPIISDFWGLCRTEQLPRKLGISVLYREMTHFQLKKIKLTAVQRACRCTAEYPN